MRTHSSWWPLHRSVLLILALLLGPWPAAPASQDAPTAPPQAKKAKKKKKAKPEPRGWYFQFKRRPSLRYADLFRVDFRVKVQADLRTVTPQDPEDRDVFDLRRNRVSVEGTFLRDFEYEAEYDFARAENGLRDAYVNYRRWRYLQPQAGRFKLPFGRDQLTPPMRLDFVYRSRLGAQIAPAREWGFMLHGPVLGQGLRYQAGLFRHDGENSYVKGEPISRPTFAARLRSFPREILPLPSLLKELELGVAGTWGKVPEGRASLNGQTAFGHTYFPRTYINGRRLRLGAELNWSPGPFSVQGEYMGVRQERLKQSVRAEDLPEVIARGWYVSGTWLLTGERKAGGVEPRRPLWRGGGFGAWELAFRQESLCFGSRPHPRPPSLSPRAPTLPTSSERASTLGVNWYVNRYVKLQGNLIRENVEDPYHQNAPLWQVYWTRVFRIQFAL